MKSSSPLAARSRTHRLICVTPGAVTRLLASSDSGSESRRIRPLFNAHLPELERCDLYGLAIILHVTHCQPLVQEPDEPLISLLESLSCPRTAARARFVSPGPAQELSKVLGGDSPLATRPLAAESAVSQPAIDRPSSDVQIVCDF